MSPGAVKHRYRIRLIVGLLDTSTLDVRPKASK
jgi:hypothetical protein